MKKLVSYREKRDFTRTREPAPSASSSTKAGTFVIQKHDASSLHYDLRFAVDGVLKSWAVPKGFPLRKGEKRLAIQVEDHPLAYANFEGSIPKGEYGGGTVMVWDRGRVSYGEKSAQTGLKHGHVDFELAGRKLRGAWMLIRLKNEETQWLLIKREDDHPSLGRAEDVSAKSGKSMKAIAATLRGAARQAKPVAKTTPRKKAPNRGGRAGFVEPMLARPTTKLPEGEEWSYEVKFDGFRAIAVIDERGGSLWSRNQNRFAKYPEIEDALTDVRLPPVVLDGELVALEPRGRSSFQQLQRFEDGVGHPPLFFYVFDVMTVAGKDVRQEPLEARRKLLSKIVVKRDGPIRLSQSLGGSVAAILKASRRHGLEGIVAKRVSSRYESGKRSGAWMKVRFVREQEFVIGGFTAPAGKRAHFGALLLGYFEGRALRYAGKVGTGFDAKTLGKLHPRLLRQKQKGSPFGDPVAEKNVTWVKPKLVGQVKFVEWTRDGHLRHPAFVGLRSDKDAEKVVREP